MTTVGLSRSWQPFYAGLPTRRRPNLRAFQLHLSAGGVQPPTINATVTVLRFFFEVTLDRPETTRHLVFVYEPRKLPSVLSPEEMLRLLERLSTRLGVDQHEDEISRELGRRVAVEHLVEELHSRLPDT